jgi:hypothetical protein
MASPTILQAVRGLEGRYNDVICTTKPNAMRDFILFPGDLSDLREVMETSLHNEQRDMSRYCLESLCTRIASKLEQTNVFVIRPCSFNGLFARFDNFVPVSPFGDPIAKHFERGCPHVQAYVFSPSATCLPHLAMLMDSCYRALGIVPFARPLAVGGFSKGGVVTCQLLAELPKYANHQVTFSSPDSCSTTISSTASSPCPPLSKSSASPSAPHSSPSAQTVLSHLSSNAGSTYILTSTTETFHISQQVDLSTITAFISRLKQLLLLDIGLNVQGVYPTASAILTPLAQTLLAHQIKLRIYTSPRQMDERRPWIRKECQALTQFLHTQGCDVNWIECFGGQSASMETHFAVLDEFKLQE